jgi:hypothetical protein
MLPPDVFISLYGISSIKFHSCRLVVSIPVWFVMPSVPPACLEPALHLTDLARIGFQFDQSRLISWAREDLLFFMTIP